MGITGSPLLTRTLGSKLFLSLTFKTRFDSIIQFEYKFVLRTGPFRYNDFIRFAAHSRVLAGPQVRWLGERGDRGGSEAHVGRPRTAAAVHELADLQDVHAEVLPARAAGHHPAA